MSRRAEGRNQFRRRPVSRKPQRDRILIVCEDSKHSVAYFKELCHDLRLTTEVRITGESGSSPTDVYAYAKKALDDDIKTHGEEDAYDHIYCIIDKDDHKDYERTLDKARRDGKPYNQKITVLPSVPCFEFWVLLHFEETSKPLTPSTVRTAIKRHLPSFSKTRASYGQLYRDHLKTNTDFAVERAEHVWQQVQGSNTDNPSTQIHQLIQHLQKESRK